MALMGKRILTFTYVWKSNIFKLIASIWKMTHLLKDQELSCTNVLLVTSIREVSKSIFPLADARNQSKIKGALLHNLWFCVQYFPTYQHTSTTCSKKEKQLISSKRVLYEKPMHKKAADYFIHITHLTQI